MKVVIVSKDSTRHEFTLGEENPKSFLDALKSRVVHGQGLVIEAPEGTMIYAPGDITRVGIIPEETGKNLV